MQFTKDEFLAEMRRRESTSRTPFKNWRIYWFEEDQIYCHADLSKALLSARTLAGAWLAARDFVLANATTQRREGSGRNRQMVNVPVDLYDHEAWSEYCDNYPDEPTISGYVDDFLECIVDNDTLWIQPADEPCRMEWYSEAEFSQKYHDHDED